MTGFIIYGSAQPLLAFIIKYFIDGLSASNPYSYQPTFIPFLESIGLIYAIPLLIIVSAVWQGIGSFLGTYFLGKTSLNLVHDLRIRLFNNLLALPNRYFDENASGHLVSRITFNVSVLADATTNAIKTLLREGMTVVFLCAALLWMNSLLTLVLMSVLPLIAFIAILANRKFRKQSNGIQTAMGDVTHVASEVIRAYRVVRSFTAESYEKKRFRDASMNSTNKQLNMVLTGAIYTPTLQLLVYTAMSALMFLVIYMRGNASAGETIAYITLACQLPKPIRQLSEVSSIIQKGLSSAESIFRQLDEPPEKDTGVFKKSTIKGSLELRKLCFTYPNTKKTVINNITFTAEPGQTIALVGRSGSGKSTLIALISRFYQQTSGEILMDGVNIERYSLRDLRSNISQVTQNVILFSKSVANNIAYGSPSHILRSDIEKAATNAYAKDFIEALPDGFDTQIGENGSYLSGGECQRLAIARALLKNSPLLILDEATSALDSESERYIQKSLDSAMKNRTTIVIAHRLSTVKKADLILVMDEGVIIERGSHRELLAQGKAYARLYSTLRA